MKMIVFNEDNSALTARTMHNDFGDIATRPSVHNTPALREQAASLCETESATDKMDTRRTVQLIRAGKFSDETLSELIAFWQSL